MATPQNFPSKAVYIPLENLVALEGDLCVPPGAEGVVLFAHGSGSSRHSPRNRYIAQELQQAGLATLLFDLLTPEEEQLDEYTRRYRFDIGLLADRLVASSDWLVHNALTRPLAQAFFGASTGAAAALLAAARLPTRVRAVVSRGGRPDLAGQALEKVRAPTLLIVGGWDEEVLRLNQQAFERLSCEKKLVVVPGATHLFEEPGKLQEVARLARDWLARYLGTEKGAHHA
ncbi:dienelactone hydrolase family protein [Meiothermus hypogaeus]|uniref:DeoR family transcriptional regulator n=2 Tax=Meiothermus hypogaeus TaxID=884155 RepID=A0A511R5Z1_9DEIN|nr:alpha/beta fold hydrolase [Meiothermus hypogaeus]RIH77480.1 putative phosphoribosyl transferase [Meiothermus hypogaeus]GEM84446.1 DeoR family transcriptional regulator [Meiothermus hypogaeus NBRC 106114]GIW35987.1 MAG: DeoR family transcriptional regulator [Meiothermus sp.]